MRRLMFWGFCVLIAAATGCKDPYEPTIISSSNSYLVVEGILNAGQGPATVRLSRSFKLDDTARLRGEQHAIVLVEGKDNSVRELFMTGDGIYTSSNLGLTLGQEYRLRIATVEGKEYASDYVVAKKAPAIDSLEFEQNEKGVQVYANTHDPANNTWYYLWDYDETWEIRTYYSSQYKYVNGVVVERTPADNVSNCWKYDYSKNILIGSSAAFRSDVISRAPLTLIADGSEKLSVRYSMLLRQYALDKAGYEFYELMKKNTESLGTIFDPQPSEVKGNIRCTSHPGELVIGHVSVSTIEEKRFFISRLQLRNWHYDQYCPSDTIPNKADEIALAYQLDKYIYGAIISPSGFISAYLFSHAPCVDCTRRGGSLLRPSYW